MNPAGLSRIAFGIQYVGTNYAGWQSQLHQNTVQDSLESAISSFLGKEHQEKVRVVVAGRTDSGVHALGQVVHFDTSVDRDIFSWVRGINAFLPKDISVHWAKFVPPEFDARFSAQERAYTYVLAASSHPLPLLNDQAGYVLVPSDRWLDVRRCKMQPIICLELMTLVHFDLQSVRVRLLLRRFINLRLLITNRMYISL